VISTETYQIIDTHAHLDAEAFDSDRNEAILRAQQAGVGAIINPGAGLAESRAAVALAEASQVIYAAVGVHPHEADTLTQDTVEELRGLAQHPCVVAIGEIGLDFYRDYAPRDAQRAAFRAQLALAREVDRPVIVHDRDAHGEVLTTLRQWFGEVTGQRTGPQRPFGVLHCFSGSLEMAREAIGLGFYIGVDGPVTFRRASRLRSIVQALPLEHLLVETDCPYLTPEPYRGHRNEPAYVRFVVEAIAELHGVPVEEAAKVTTANARRVFRFPEA
jgi:TatD DNase family protein